MSTLRKTIEDAWERRAELTPSSIERSLKLAIDDCIALLDSGKARIAEPVGDDWQVNEWLKKAVLLSFRLNRNVVIEGGFSRFYDKVPLRWGGELAGVESDGLMPALTRRTTASRTGTLLVPSSAATWSTTMRAPGG